MSSEKVLYRLNHPHGPGNINISWRPGNSTHLATTGSDSTVAIFDRQGELQERLHLPGNCTGFGWDSDGDVLAVITGNSSVIILWDATTGKKSQVDAGVRDGLSCMAWARKNCILAVGTQKGNLAIYDHINAKRIPVLGKHRKRITCAVWSIDGLLALASEDRTLTISTSDGDTRREIVLQGEPSGIQFGEMKTDYRAGGENTISLVVGKSTLFLYNILEPDNPIELSFQKRYGPIVTHKWYGDGYILIGFEAGYLIAISTHMKEVGQELFQLKNHRDCLNDISLSTTIDKVVTCGDNNIKIHSLKNLEEVEKVINVAGETGINKAEWSADGSMIAAITLSGHVLVYLVEVPQLRSVYGNKIAILSSLSEVYVYQCTIDKVSNVPMIINTVIEPSLLAVGSNIVAVASNNRALFWDLNAKSDDLSTYLERDYIETIDSMCLNDTYVSVLFDGQLQLHVLKLDQTSPNNQSVTNLPGDNEKITCHYLTQDFLVYGTDMGFIVYYSLEVLNQSRKFSHVIGIKQIMLDTAGVYVSFVDKKGDVFIYDPVNDHCLQVPDCPESVEDIIWNQNPCERNIFAVCNKTTIANYVFVKYHIEGSKIVKIGVAKVPLDAVPLYMYSGTITLSTANGKLIDIVLPIYEDVSNICDEGKLRELLDYQIISRRFMPAWLTCKKLNDRNCWIKLAQYALMNTNAEIATRAYRQIEDVSMAWALQKLQNIFDINLLCGHICLLLEKCDLAEKFFLNSSQPVQALHLRRDTMQWVQALNLAKTLNPSEIPYIAKEYAQQLEFLGNYPKAMVHYEQGLMHLESASNTVQHRNQCLAGIARMSIRCGDVRRGVEIALDNNHPKNLKKECAEILESMKQHNDAAMLYEKAEHFDKAAMMYIKLKNWPKVGQLLPQISSPKINVQYAKAKESEGNYEEAARAYETAKDYENIIRINLKYLNNPARSVEIVQETKSVEGAKLVAEYFQQLNDYNSAIKFLVLSNCFDEAYHLANQHSKMELYGEILIETIDDDNDRKDDFRSLAIYFELQKNSYLAGKYYYHAGEYEKALKHLTKAAQLNTDDDLALSLAIDVVASSKDEKLANQLIDFLLGAEGLPRDPKYLFRLYMALKLFREAAKTAVIIANEEQINGNYRNAHDILFGMCQELKENHIPVPLEMQNNMRLLHSYILVRLHVKKQNHYCSARMLIRVVNNISKFPSHIVPIMTSAVIECQRAGLKDESFNFAAMLMSPEYKSQIDSKYIKRIEAIVRKPPKNNIEKVTEKLTPCPYCKNKLPETEVNCDICRNTIPFCIATGYHIIEDDFTVCPSCDFPAIQSEFVKIIEADGVCPMCSQQVDLESIISKINIKSYL